MMGLFWAFFVFFATSILAQGLDKDILYISNTPESVAYPGLILSRSLENQSMRLLYHHRNISLSPLYVTVLVSNATEKPAEVQIVSGVGGSTEDIVFAGHKAMVDFLTGLTVSGNAVVIPPFSSVALASHKIKPMQTSSGMLRVVPLTHRPVGVKVAVVDELFPQVSGFMDVGSVWDQYRVFEVRDGYKRMYQKVYIPTENISVRVGGKPYLIDERTRRDIKGNYGRVYDLFFSFVNSSSESQVVRGYVMPLKKGGVDRGVFLIDGELKELGILKYSDTVVQSEEFLELVVPPNTTKELSILTIPQAGCFYPIEMSFKVVP